MAGTATIVFAEIDVRLACRACLSSVEVPRETAGWWVGAHRAPMLLAVRVDGVWWPRRG